MIEAYATPAAVEAAIKTAAQKAAALDPSLSVNERIRLESFNRFLSRVFIDGDNTPWLLKGGTSMLARIPSTRATLDIDLYHRNSDLDRSLNELRRLIRADLGDHFLFEYAGHAQSLGGEQQPYAEAYRVKFSVYIGAQPKGFLHVDLAIGVGITAPATTTHPANALDLPRLVSNPYRLYPTVDQIADKVCATHQTYNGRGSTREKDLVDLVVLALTQDIDGAALTTALQAETRRRRMTPIQRFAIPTGWGAGYRKLARTVILCADHPAADLAAELVSRLIDPALTGDASGKWWSKQKRKWITH